MEILDDVTRPFAVLEAGIAQDLADSRAYDRRSLVSTVVVCACALALAILVVLGAWPPPEVQVAPRVHLTDPG